MEGDRGYKTHYFFLESDPGKVSFDLPLPPPSWALLPGLGIKGGSTALIVASSMGKVEVVEALLAAGADREAKDKVRAPPCPPRPPLPPLGPPYDPPIGSDPIGHGLRYGGGGVEKGRFWG